MKTGVWRSGWDSNPREVALKLISNQPRYDHFDTAPYLVCKDSVLRDTSEKGEKSRREKTQNCFPMILWKP